jgi:hypothetical protein
VGLRLRRLDAGVKRFFIIFFPRWYWALNSGFEFVRQELYRLSNVTSSFCSEYFGDRVSLFAHQD